MQISPFRPYQRLPRLLKPPETRGYTALVMPRGLVGLWSTDMGLFARFSTISRGFHRDIDIFVAKSPLSVLQSRSIAALCAGPTTTSPLGTAKAVAAGPSGLGGPHSPWYGPKGEIGTFTPPAQRGVFGDPDVPFKLRSRPSRAAHFKPGCTLKKSMYLDGRWWALEALTHLNTFSSGTEE